MSGLDLDYLFGQIKDSVNAIVGQKFSVYDAMKEYQAYIDRLNAKIDNLPKSVPEPLRIGILGEYNALVDLSISLRNKVAGDDEAFNNFSKAFSNELIKQGYISKPLTRDETYPYWGRFFIKPLENICEKLTKKGIVRSGICSGATKHLAGYEPLVLGEVSDYYTFEQISELAELGFDPITLTVGSLVVITLTVGAVLATKYLSANELKNLETIRQMDKLNDEILRIQKSNLPKEEKDKQIAVITKSIQELSKVASSGGGISFNPLWIALMVAVGFAGYRVYKKFKG